MYLKIRVTPESKEEKVEVIGLDEIRIWTKMPAERNLANNRVIEILKERYPAFSIRIVSGHHSPSKIVSIN
jgi:uncharacterized protein YggU (UPF0235/DUF167 family)